MKKICFLLFSIICVVAVSQDIEIFVGPNQNIFHDYSDGEGHFNSSYKDRIGYSFGVGIENIKIDWLKLRLALSYEKYGGELAVTSGGLGGEFTTAADIDKSVVSFGIYPINLTFIKRFNFNAGIEISRLVYEDFSGTNKGWIMGGDFWSYNIEDKYDRYSTRTIYGLKGRLAYDFKITESINLSPQYCFYYGLSHEFDEFPQETLSMKHFLGIGIKKTL